MQTGNKFMGAPSRSGSDAVLNETPIKLDPVKEIQDDYDGEKDLKELKDMKKDIKEMRALLKINPIAVPLTSETQRDRRTDEEIIEPTNRIGIDEDIKQVSGNKSFEEKNSIDSGDENHNNSSRFNQTRDIKEENDDKSINSKIKKIKEQFEEQKQIHEKQKNVKKNTSESVDSNSEEIMPPGIPSKKNTSRSKYKLIKFRLR